MQIEKFFKAQELRKEIKDIELVIQDMESNSFALNPLDKLNIELKNSLMSKTKDVIKKELQRVIKIKEKEFIDL